MKRRIQAAIGFFSVLALVLGFSLSGCDRLPTQPQQTAVDDEVANVVIENLEVPEPEVQLDLQKGAVEIQHGPRFSYHRLGCILRKLRLSREQWDSVRAYLREYRQCVWEVRDSVRRAAWPIIEEFREQFREAIQKYRNGEIDRDSLFALIRELRHALREAFADLREWAQEQMQHCRDALYEHIRSILTEEQQAIWDEWVENGGHCRWPRDGGWDRDHGRWDRDHGRWDRDHGRGHGWRRGG